MCLISSMEITDRDWTALDEWWEPYIDLDRSVLTDGDSVVLDRH